MMNINLRFKSFIPLSEGQVRTHYIVCDEDNCSFPGGQGTEHISEELLVFSIFSCIYLAVLGLP